MVRLYGYHVEWSVFPRTNDGDSFQSWGVSTPSSSALVWGASAQLEVVTCGEAEPVSKHRTGLEIPMDMTRPRRRVAIVTALQLECTAVTAMLGSTESARFENSVYERGVFVTPHETWDVIVAEFGPGNVSSAIQTERILRGTGAELVLLIGVAGGVKDVKLGDVVAATKVHAYEGGSDGKRFLPRPDLGRCSERLEQEARATSRRTEWLDRCGAYLGEAA